jgi:uncharacterized membrane protein YhaH (DUF805 family)
VKRLFSAVLTAWLALLLAVPAFADAAVPSGLFNGRPFFMGGVKMLVAVVVAVVIVAVAIIVVAVRYRQDQAAEIKNRSLSSDEPEEK